MMTKEEPSSKAADHSSPGFSAARRKERRMCCRLSDCGQNCGQAQASTHPKQLDVKDERGIWGDDRRITARAITET